MQPERPLSPQPERPIAEIEPAAAWAGVRDGSLLLVDVREPEEWDAGRAPGALHLPLGRVDAHWDELAAAGRTIAFVCHVGQRSALATLVAARIGVAAVNVAGGMVAWERARLPLERGGA